MSSKLNQAAIKRNLYLFKLLSRFLLEVTHPHTVTVRMIGQAKISTFFSTQSNKRRLSNTEDENTANTGENKEPELASEVVIGFAQQAMWLIITGNHS